MGQPLAKAHANQDSPTTPGLRSVLTDELDDFCSCQRLWSELKVILQDPLLIKERPVLKRLELTERSGPLDLRLRVVLDGQKLRALKLADGREDVLFAHHLLLFDEEKLEARLTELDPKDEKVVMNRTTIRVLRQPLRLEAWMNRGHDNKRSTGEVLAGYVEKVVLAPILMAIKSCKVQVDCDVEVPEVGGRCVVSEALDGLCDEESLGRELLTTLKNLNASMAKVISFYGGARASEMEFEEISEVQFVTRQMVPNPALPEELGASDRDKQLFRLMDISLSEAHGEIRVETSLNGEREEMGYYRILHGPLRLAHWKEQKGRRLAGREPGAVLRVIVRTLLDGSLQAEGGEQFFF